MTPDREEFAGHDTGLASPPADPPRQGVSYGQKALWFLHRLAPESNAYHIASALRLTGPLNIAALKHAYEQLARRHAALRTTFVEIDGAPFQRIHADLPPFFHYQDAATWTETELRQELNREAARPFDLVTGPLFRASVYRRVDHEHVMLAVAHHMNRLV